MSARLSHVFMLVSNLAAERHLLVDVIGLEVLVDEDGYLRVGGNGGFHLGLEQGDPGVAGDAETNIKVDDVDAAYARLVEAEVPVEGPPEDQEWGARHVWLRDVDGRRMSVFS